MGEADLAGVAGGKSSRKSGSESWMGLFSQKESTGPFSYGLPWGKLLCLNLNCVALLPLKNNICTPV
jgi:hypothetical protein